MSIPLTAKDGPNNTIILTWTRVPGVDGYRFYSAGVFRSDTWDADRTSVKFSKGQEPYVVEAIVVTAWSVKDKGTYPAQPPPVFKLVAPRVAYKEGGSDARYCLVGQPGVGLQPDGTYRDEVAQYAPDGLCLGAERSGGSAADGIVGAKQIDGRPLCSLPMPGDRTKNTGSWAI